MTEESVFIGIDLGSRAMTYATLDSRLNVIGLGQAALEDTIRVVTAYPQVTCAIDAPSGFNKGLLADPDYRVRMGLRAERNTYNNYRVCEYELRRRGISVYNTPLDRDQAKEWMHTGWDLYQRLREADFVDYPRPGSRRLLETYPHAIFTVLAGGRLYSKKSLEGRLQRQLILQEEGLNVPDAMRVFEEWTRHRFLTGRLNMEHIYDHDRLDALAAAYVAFLAEREPHHITVLGDPIEGQIVLPGGH